MRIQHNINALNSHRQMGVNTNNSGKNLEKLSSGFRINRAGDDAAGLAISEKMRGQIRGLDMASKNAQDGISLIQTAEGALNETHSILQRMRELSVQSSNGIYDNPVDRSNLDKEVNALKSELDRIATATDFNGIQLLDGSQEEGYSMSINAGVSTADKATGVTLGKTAAVAAGAIAGMHESSVEVTAVGGLTTEKITGAKQTITSGAAASNAVQITTTAPVTTAGSEAHGHTKITFNSTKLASDLGVTVGTAASDYASFVDALNGTSLNLGGIEFTFGTGAGQIDISGMATGTYSSAAAANEALAGAVQAAIDGKSNIVAITGTATVSSSAATNTPAIGSAGSQAVSFYIKGMTLNEAPTVSVTGGAKPDEAKLTFGSAGSIVSGTKVELNGKTYTLVNEKDKDAFKNATDVVLFKDSDSKEDIATNFYNVASGKDTTLAGGTNASKLINNGDGTLSYLKGTATGATVPEFKLTVAGGAAGATKAFNTSLTFDFTAGKGIEEGATFTVGGKTFEFGSTASGSNIAIDINFNTTGTAAAAANMTKIVDALKNEGINITKGTGADANKITFIGKAGADVEAKGAAKAASTELTFATGVEDRTSFKLGNNTYTIYADADEARADANGIYVANLASASGGAIAREVHAKLLNNAAVTEIGKYTLNSDKISIAGGDNLVSDLKGTPAPATTTVSFGDSLQPDAGVPANSTLTYGGKTYELVTDADNKKGDSNIAVVVGDLKDTAAIAEAFKNAINTETGDTKASVVDGELVLSADNSSLTTSPTVTTNNASEVGITFQIGANGNDDQRVTLKIGNMSHVGLGLDAISIETQGNANNAIDVIDQAINTVSSTRADLGALQNRLEHTVNNLGVNSENLTAAESRIRDVDMAKEMMEFTKNNILNQAAQAMLAQANQQPQGVLQLLR